VPPSSSPLCPSVLGTLSGRGFFRGLIPELRSSSARVSFSLGRGRVFDPPPVYSSSSLSFVLIFPIAPNFRKAFLIPWLGDFFRFPQSSSPPHTLLLDLTSLNDVRLPPPMRFPSARLVEGRRVVVFFAKPAFFSLLPRLGPCYGPNLVSPFGRKMASPFAASFHCSIFSDVAFLSRCYSRRLWLRSCRGSSFPRVFCTFWPSPFNRRFWVLEYFFHFFPPLRVGFL